MAAMNDSNPLVSDWNTPYGLPPFDLIKAEHFGPALDRAMAEHKRELAALGANPAAPDFANTIEAFDRAGALLQRVGAVYGNYTGSVSTPEMQAVEREYAPKLGVHMAGVYLDAPLFARVDAVHAKRHSIGLSPVQVRLVERIHLDFTLAGARLDAKKKTRLEQIVKELADKYTAFSQRLLADEEETYVLVEKSEELAGLPADFVAAAAELATAKCHPGGWAVSVSRSMVEPCLTHADNRSLRRRVHEAFKARGELAPGRDTKALIKEILVLRAELASLHGHACFADYALVDRMAKKPEAVATLLERVWKPALARSLEERKALAALARELDGVEKLEAADWLYYAEKLRIRDYDLDEASVKPYFALDRMVKASFDAAGRLFGIEFKEIPGVPLYHPDAKLYEVRNAKDRKLIGVFITDHFARAGKQSGAWMSTYRDQAAGVIPIVTNNLNCTRPAAGAPALISFDDVKTLFHEFGHGLHGLLSDVPYRTLSGTSVLRDFVELPSQLFEHWALAPEILATWATHHETGKPIPAELVEKIRKTMTFNMGWETVQYLGPALLDMELHNRSDYAGFDAAAYEKEACARLGLPAEVGLRHRLPHFQHAFAGDGYSAGYYVYMWAEVLDADAWAAFEEKGDSFDPELAAKLRKHIYSAGNSVDPAETYRAFRGRDATVEPLLRQRGLL